MGITIRPKEPMGTITLSKGEWLSVLVFLNQFQEQAASEEIDRVLKSCITQIRSFILKKGESSSCLELSKQDALEFYLHLKDFQSKIEDENQIETVHSVCETIKIFLLEGKDEQQS